MDMVCASLAFIDGLGGPEMLLIFVLILVLFGGQKLPEFARGLGKTMREFKKAAAGVEDEFKRALEEDERKNAPKLTAAPVEPTSTYDPASDSSTDPAGPEAEVQSPVTDDDVTHDEHSSYDEAPPASDDVIETSEPDPALAEEPSENKIPPPTPAPVPAAPAPVPPPPSPPKSPVSPPASSSPENPS